MSDHTTPPEQISSYHAPWLEAAEAGRLRYNFDRYRIHGVNNNTLACLWTGLLADGTDGPSLTDLGARLLAEWRQANPGRWGARPGPMTPETAAAIRATAWTQGMRHQHETTPRAASTCLCQSGPTPSCEDGHHARCARPTPLPRPEGHISWPDGRVAVHPELYTHTTPTATGPQRTAHAQTWLADRVCRWLCPCDCHTPAALEEPVEEPPKPHRKRPTPLAPAAPAMPGGWQQPDLFADA